MKKKKYGILLDTGAGDDPKIFKGTNIHLIPLHLVFEDGTDIKDTPANLKKYDFYKRVKDGEAVRTSQASPGELMEKYRELLNDYEHIIHLPIAKNLSSMYQTASVVSLEFPDQISVIDSSMAANGLKEVALELNRQLDLNPKMTLDQILNFLKEYQNNMYLGLIPGDLRRFDKGGRGSSTLKSIINLLKIKILISWEEVPRKESVGRTIGSVMETATNHVNDFHGERYKAIFVSTPVTDNKILNSAIKILEEKKIDYIKEYIPPMYAAHAGANTIGLIFVKIYENIF